MPQVCAAEFMCMPTSVVHPCRSLGYQRAIVFFTKEPC